MKLLRIIGLFLLFTSCNSEQNNSYENPNVPTEVIDIDSANYPDAAEGGVGNLPEEGIVSFDYEKYYPGILDTIKDRRITMANKISMKTRNGIIVSVLNNHGTFDQMFLCTHDSLSKLINSYYIGKSTMWDDGKSHSIEKEIVNDSMLIFHYCDFGYNKDSEIDTLKYYSKIVMIQEDGIIKEIK